MRITIPFVIAAITCSGATTVSAETFVFGSGLPESSYMSEQMTRFMDCVKSGSNGEIEFQFYPNGTLIKREGLLRALQSGQVQFAELNISAYGNEDEIFNLPPIPGLARDIDQLRMLWNAEEEYLKDWFSGRGITLLFPMHWPGQGIYTSSKIETEDQTKGKLYVYSPATQRLGELMGFEPVVLPFSEIPQAFATGMIEAMYTSAQTGVDIQAWDFVSHYSYAGGGSQAAVGMNTQALDKLNDEAKNVVLSCAAEAKEAGFQMTRENSAALLDALREKGMEVNDMPPAVRAEFDRAGDAMLTEWKSRASDEQLKILERYLTERGG